MQTIWQLTAASMKMFVRNRQALFFTVISPVIIMSIFGLLSLDRVPQVSLGVAVNAPPTPGTENFLNQLKEVPAFEVHVGTEEAERQALDSGERSAVLVIPGDFFPEQPDPAQPPKQAVIYTNAGDAQQAATAVSIVSQILDRTTLAVTGAPALFELRAEEVNARNLGYIDFLVPGVVALAIMQMAVFSVAFVFADFKEKGIMKRLLATPMQPFQFVTANVITRLVIAVAQSAILIAVGVLLFNAQVIGSYWLLIPIIILGAVMFLGLGFTISGFANTVEAVPAIANLVVFPMLFLGGTFFPIETMPEWLQKIAAYLPLTYLSESLRDVMINGASLSDVQTELFWMAGWSALLVLAANLTFRMEEKRQ
jgi:ABC-2 type transport system permease protein